MKKLILLTVLLLGMVIEKINAQSSSGANTWFSGYYLGWSSSHDLPFLINGSTFMTLTIGGFLGVGTATPANLIEAAGGNINITTSTNGYMLGGQYLAWTSNDVTSLYLGIGAIGGVPAGAVGMGENTVVGGNAGFDLGASTSTGWENTMTGYNSGYKLTTGTVNTYYGVYAGYWNSVCSNNTLVGDYAGFNTGLGSIPNQGCYNTMVGDRVGYYNQIGTSNNYYGKEAGYTNQGNQNCIFGSHSGWTGEGMDSNVFMGNYCAQNTMKGNNNVFIGASAANNTASVNFFGLYNGYNTFIGANSGPNTIYGGYYNILLGYEADAYSGSASNPGVINNAGAIGASSVVTANNSIILGNNNQWSGIGLSYNPSDVTATGKPNNSLEICARDHTGAILPCTSGLRLTNLISSCVPVTNPGTGVLTVDGNGDVIYVTEGSGSGGIGSCASPSVFSPGATNDPSIDLQTNNHNFWFQGNNDTKNFTNVYIGYPCPSGGTYPLAKLNVLQNSGDKSTICGYFENDDLAAGSTGTGAPVIGIESYVPASGANTTSIAGYFNAPSGTSSNDNMAIIVPSGGGRVGFGTTAPLSALDVRLNTGGGNTAILGVAKLTTLNQEAGIEGIAANAPYASFGVIGAAAGRSSTFSEGVYGWCTNSSSQCAGVFVGNVFTTGGSSSGSGFLTVSDSSIKTKINSFSNALSLIKQFQPRTYYFDTANRYKFQLDTFKHYGFIAQQIKPIAPCLVHTVVTPPQIDTAMNITVQASTINALDYNQFIAILTAGFQEHLQITYNDSVKQKQTNDSLRYEVDSLRSAFKNIQNCLNQLCGNGGHAPTHGNGNDSGSGNNAMNNNIQVVTLSGLMNAPLLYQNTPNPFSKGTAINYFLPEGTMGAKMLFFDTYGNQLKSIDLNQTGNGTLNIAPDNLQSGIYSYSLVVNNRVIDTKRMVLQK